MSGGTQRHLIEVLKFIDRSRFRPLVVVAKSGGDLGRVVAACDVELIELGLGESLWSADFVRCVRRTARLFLDRAVDVVQCFQWRPALIGIGAARLARRGRIVAGRRSVPVERGLRALLDDLVVQLADRVVVNAESLRPHGRAAERTEVIPSGVDTDRFQRAPGERERVRATLGIPAGVPLIGTVGRLEGRKGTDTLIASAAQLRTDAHVVVVGDGPSREALAAQVARLGLGERVRLLGERADVREVLAALDVFVLPSRTEGMSNALLEGMAMALPVVATAVGGNPEVVTPGTGVLVPAEDPGAMAAAVTDLLDAPERAAALGSAARRRVEERYGARAMVRRLEAVYDAVATGALALSRVASAA
jgi:glycosyltransferase involved in cell wall biosynthesis